MHEFFNTIHNITITLFLISCNLTFSLMNIDLDQGIYNEKTKVARNEKQKKTRWVFLYIQYSKFEAFRWNISWSRNLPFVKSAIMR